MEIHCISSNLSRSWFTSRRLCGAAKHNIVHIATHAYSNTSLPADSGEPKTTSDFVISANLSSSQFTSTRHQGSQKQGDIAKMNKYELFGVHFQQAAGSPKPRNIRYSSKSEPLAVHFGKLRGAKNYAMWCLSANLSCSQFTSAEHNKKQCV